jgi:pilus assembly protein TadC
MASKQYVDAAGEFRVRAEIELGEPASQRLAELKDRTGFSMDILVEHLVSQAIEQGLDAGMGAAGRSKAGPARRRV